ncbi:MAG: translocation/assembly module TamB domain-containing protein [Nonlabens sp.]
MLLLALFLILIIAFSNSRVQSWAAGKATTYLNDEFNTQIEIEKIQFTYSGKVVIKEAVALDHHQDTVIYFSRLDTSILGFGQLMAGSPQLGSTQVDGLYLNIYKYAGEQTDNLDQFITSFDSDQPSTSSKPFLLEVSNLKVTNSRLHITDEDLRIQKSFIASKMNLDATDFKVKGSNIYAQIKDGDFHFYNGAMKMGEEGINGLDVKHLSADFTYTPNNIIADRLDLQTAGSYLKGDLTMNYNREDFAEFITKVLWDFNIKEADLSTNELRQFYDEIVPNESIQISGVLKGTLNDFVVKGLKATTLDDISINGNMHFKNLLENEDDFFIEGDFENLQLSNRDLKRFLPRLLGKTMPRELDQLGTIKATGYASVNSSSVVSRLNGNSRRGSFSSNITLGAIQSGNVTYNGNIKLNKINIGALLNQKDFGYATVDLNLNGRGFNFNQTNSRIKGKIKSLDYNGYTYTNITIDGKLKKPLFDGEFSIDDPNFKAEFKGLADLSEKINDYNFTATIDYADLNKIQLFTRDSIAILKGSIDMNMRGTTLDNAYGYINIKNASYKNEDIEYNFERFELTSRFDENGVRTISASSPDVVQGNVTGDFKLAEIDELLRNSIGMAYSNFEYENLSDGQFIKYDFKIYDKIVNLALPDIDIGPNTTLKGQLASDARSFKLDFNSPHIALYGIDFEDLNLKIDNNNPIFNTYLKVAKIDNPVMDVEDFQLINITRNDTLLFRTEFANADRIDDIFNLGFYHTLDKENKSIVGIRKSDLKFQGKKWDLNAANKKTQLVFDHSFNNIKLDTLVARYKNERIELAGLINGEETKQLHLDFENVRIASLVAPIDSLKLRGKINGVLDVQQVNGNYAPSSDFTVKDFIVNDTPLGDFDLLVKGNEDLSVYSVDAQLVSSNARTMSALGTINTTGENSIIDVDTKFNEFNLVALSPLGGEVIDQIRGLASGEIHLGGKLIEPDIDGRIGIKGAGLRLPYLNTDFDFQENAVVKLTTNSFQFDDIQLTDTKYKTTGNLKGEIKHKNFGFWELDLELDSRRLLVLDTELTPESLYYGTAFIDGTATLTGPTDALFIDVVATSREDTVFKIPIDDGESLGDTSAIYFLSPEEKLARISGEEIKRKQISGLELRFDLRITPVAEVEITVDPTNGSYLRGSGFGNLLIEINTNGKFVMNGDFLVTEGIYDFKYAGIVNKNFIIEPGGTMNWTGDPANANINVSAVYSTRANPSILLDNPNLNAQIPVEVVTTLDGDLSYFDPEFQIRFPNTNSVVSSELQYRLEDRSQRQLQALSLVTSGSFYNPNSIGQNAVTGNVVESFTGIVNDLVSRDDSRLDFGVSYEATERNPNSDLQRSDRFGITLSTQITDRVFINGKLGVPIGSTSATERAVIGNVEIEFLLNTDGTIRLKLFNRENTLQQFGQQEDYTQGLGLQYQVNFDSLKEFYQKIFKKKMKATPITLE